MSVSLLSRQLNPDEDFVLHGRAAPYWEKSGFYSNSRLTNTTARLSQHTLYDPDNYRERRQHERKFARTLTDVANNLEFVGDKLDDTLRHGCSGKTSNDYEENLLKASEVTRASLHESLRTDVPDDELLKLYEKKVERLDEENLETQNICGKPVSPQNAQWYVNPRHLPSKLEAPTFQTVGQTLRNSERVAENYSERDETALKYFPVTLGEAYQLCAEGFPEYKALLTGAPPSVKMTWSRSRPRSASPTMPTKFLSGKRRDHFDERQELEKSYYISAEAPNIGLSSVFTISPYRMTIGQLRLKRLQMEEERLLHLKRLAELERIRGPKPKWYSSKGQDFHYESHKNTHMIKCENLYRDLLDYREDLLRSAYLSMKKYNKTVS